jgi:hypothetical protein
MANWIRPTVLVMTAAWILGVGGFVAFAQPTRAPVTGNVVDVADDVVSLEGGQSFTVSDETRVFVVHNLSPADLVPGQYVAITGRAGEDGVLDAAIVSAFPEEQSRTADVQQPMGESNFMTYATIADAVLRSVDSGSLTISFHGLDAQVRILPETAVEVRQRGSLEAVGPGATIVAFLTDGAARTISVY